MKTILIMTCLAMVSCVHDDWHHHDASDHHGTMTKKSDGTRSGPPTPVSSPTRGPMMPISPNAGMGAR